MSRNRFAATAGAVATIAGLTAVAVVPAVSAKTARPASSSAAVLKVASVTIGSGRHSLLESSNGRAVYLLTGDSVSHPLCDSAECLGDWPVVGTTVKSPVLGRGVKGRLTVWHHGKYNQLVLNGHPLYTFAGDSSVGKAGGQGIKSDGGVWETLSAGGVAFTAATSSAKSSSSATSTSTSSGSGW